MIALSLETAKTIAIVVALVLVASAIVSAWLIKNLVTKVIMVVLLAGLALGVWTQRADLQDCADRAQAALDVGLTKTSITCTFLGSDVTIGVGD